MGKILMLAVALSVLQLFLGTDAARSHPSSKVFVPPINNTTWTRHLMDEVYQDSGDAVVYFAYHGGVDTTHGYYGFVATMDVYGLQLAAGQGSAAAVWLHEEGDGAPSSLRSIMIGWDVLPTTYGDSRTHFYTKWTNDGFQTTGCLNMKCLGFLPEKGARIAPGDVIDHVTVPKGAKRNLNLKITKHGASGDWLVHCGVDRAPELIGRFPRSLFTGGFQDRATSVAFGGVVAGPAASPPPMGSGVLPAGDVRSTASVSGIRLVDEKGRAWPVAGDMPKAETNPAAYAASAIVGGKFLYGGPGLPKQGLNTAEFF